MYRPRGGVTRRIATARVTSVTKSLGPTIRSPRDATAPRAGTGTGTRPGARPAPRWRSPTHPLAEPHVAREDRHTGDRDQGDLQVRHGSVPSASVVSRRSSVVPSVSIANGLGRYPATPNSRSRAGLTAIALATTTGGLPAASNAPLRRTDQPVSPGRLMSSRTMSGWGSTPRATWAASAVAATVT